jgi:hypothetical protein
VALATHFSFLFFSLLFSLISSIFTPCFVQNNRNRVDCQFFLVSKLVFIFFIAIFGQFLFIFLILSFNIELIGDWVS